MISDRTLNFPKLQFSPSLIAQLVKKKKILLQCQRPWFNSWVRKIHWRRDGLPTPVFLGFPCGSAGKESACNVEDLGSIPGLGRAPGGGHGNPLQYSCLENPHGQRSCLENPHGQRSLAGYRPSSCKESDTTERLSTQWQSQTFIFTSV